jgi:hypothetical protein
MTVSFPRLTETTTLCGKISNLLLGISNHGRANFFVSALQAQVLGDFYLSEILILFYICFLFFVGLASEFRLQEILRSICSWGSG